MWSFLSNLGSGLARIGSGFAHGVASVGKGIGRGVGRLGHLASGEDLEPSGPGGTPGINPNAGYPGLTPGINPAAARGVRGVEDAVAAAEFDARADFGANPMPLPSLPARPELPDLPIKRGDLPIPALTPAPSLAELRSPLPNLPAARRVTPIAAPGPAPVAAGIDALKPEMDMDRRNVPIPRLPGKSGPPIPYNTIDAAKYDAVMAHAKRDPEGNILGRAEGGGFRRDWGMSLKNALLGASASASSARPGEDPLGRAIGGALTAGVGSAIDPQAGYEFAFDVGERPKLEAEIGRARAEQDRQRIERMAAMDEVLKRGQVDRIPLEAEAERAKIEGARAATEIARQNASRQDALTQSQIKLNEARAEAVRTGRPVYKDIVQDGKVMTVAVFPDGEIVRIGASGAAELKRQDREGAMERTKVQQAGATGRTAMSQAGANARSAASIAGAEKRTQMRIDASADQGAQGGGGSKLRKPPSGGSSGGQGGKETTMSKLREFYKKRGVTDDAEIRKRAAKFGYTVKD